MPTTSLPIPMNGFSDSLNHQHGAEGFSTSMMNVVPMDNWDHRRRVGTRQGFTALADMGSNNDYNIQELLAYQVYRDISMRHEVLIVSGTSGPVAATATVTFTGAPAVDEVITIIDTAGTSKTYTAKGSETLGSGYFNQSGTTTATAQSLEDCINHASGHNGTITAANVANVLTLTQVSKGTGGNTTITHTPLANTTVVGFVNGDDKSGVFYADSNGDTHDIVYSVAAATATVTFTGDVTADKTITITDTAGTAIEYTAKAGTTVGDNEFKRDGTVTEIAAALASCINDTTDGHGNTITAVASVGVVTLTQDVLGTATSTGNTDVTSTLDNATATNFSGAAYAAGTGRIQSSDIVRATQFGDTAYLVTGRHYYKIDLSATTPVIEEWTNLNGSGGMPTDGAGNKCTIISIFGGRIVMSGLVSSSNNWFMSKIGDAEDWSPTSGATGAHDAQAGDSSTDFGVLGEPITALFPFGDSGLMMAGRSTLTYLTADPAVSGAQLVRMSNGVGVMGPNAWCQGPEKTCYVVSGDGVYLIQPNDFNIQRGQSITSGRLDGFFSSVTSSETEVHLAYDPPRSTVLMFVERESDPSNVTHYQLHIPTQSWWAFNVSDPRMDIVKATCLYSAALGGRVGLWLGCKSGRILTQPTTGIFSFDGGAHANPLKATSNNSPVDGKEPFSSRLAWSPINAGLSNQRLLMTEIDVLLDTHTVTPTQGITPVGPTLTLFGAETAQLLSGLTGNIVVTETQLVIDCGVATFVADVPSTSFDCGNADTKGYAVISVAAPTATDHGIAEQQYIILTDNETTPVTKRYVVVDGSSTGAVATGTAMVTGADTGAGTLPAELSPAVAVNMNTTGTLDNAKEFLIQLKAAIEDSDGHNGKIVVSTVTEDVGASATFVGTAALNGKDGTDLILKNTDGSTVTFTTDPTLNFGDVTADIGDPAATATIVGTADLDDEDGTDFILTNADGSTVTFHTDPTKNFGDTSDDGGDHTWIINTRDIEGGDEVRKATQAIHIACLAAIAAGELDMTAVPSTNTGTQTSFTLTQTTAGTVGNTAITLVTGVTANGETTFTGGFDGQRWRLNTRDISGGSEVRKATQAFWIACKGAIDAGELDMTIAPTTVDTIADGSQVDFTLTQTVAGASGNTPITLITGMTADGETAFGAAAGAGGGLTAGADITLTQYTAFRGGNTPITETIASAVTIPSTFVGGQTTAVGTEYTPAIEATISLHDSSISNLNNETIILNDLSSSTTAVTLTFDSSLSVNASTTEKIGCSDADGNLLSIMGAIKKSIDLNYQAGFLNIRTEEPTLDSGTPKSQLVLRMSDAWNGLDLLTGLTLTGTAIVSNDIQDETFALQDGTNWKQFITGGRAADTTGTYTLNDSTTSESLWKWSRLGSYTVRKGGNTSVPEPAQFTDKWGVFGLEDVTVPLYLAPEKTASLSLSSWTSTEILPSGFTASTVLAEALQESTDKRELATFALNSGRNNRFRLRKRESDFQIQISATGTTWVLEDIAVNIEQGGMFRTVKV